MCAIRILRQYREVIVLANEKSTSPLSFEQTLSELEKIVSDMEQGDLPLQTALEKFERGVSLAKVGQKTLQEAEQKVQILIDENGQQSLQPMTKDNNE